MKKLLIVVDMQNDFIDGSLGTKEAQAIVPNVKKKISEYMANDDVIVFTRDTHDKNYLKTQEGKKLPVPHCIRGTYGWKIKDGLTCGGSIIIDKVTFGYDSWMHYLSYFDIININEIESIELIGICTDICVISNAIILKTQFFETPIYVDASCCAGVTPESHKAALTTMKMCQINVIGE